jgi:hypothetical protein
MNITKHLRVIRNAWRFRFAQVQPSVTHTLMRRYALGDDFARFIEESSSN